MAPTTPPLIFAPSAGQTQTILNNISDQAGNEGTGSDSGSWSLQKRGAVTLVLAGTNTYTGRTFLNGGILSVGSDSSLGDSMSPLTFNGGTLQITGTSFNATNRTITWNGGGFDIDDPANTFTVSQSLTGTGSLTKVGLGTLILTSVNTYSGGTDVKNGALVISSDQNLGKPYDVNTAPNATLMLGDTDTVGLLMTSNSFTLSRPITLNGIGGGSFYINNSTLTVDKPISGTGRLAKTDNGKLILANNNTYTGQTGVYLGQLQIGDGGMTGSLMSDVILAPNTQLIFNRSNDFTYANQLSGYGSLVKDGGGTLTLSQNNSLFTGNTTIQNGSLKLTHPNALGTGAVTNSSTLDLNFSGIFVNNITGGTTTISGSSVALTGINDTFWNILSAGKASITTPANLGSKAITLAGSLNLDPTGGFTFNNPLSGSGVLNTTMINSNDVFNFTSTTGNAFAGTVALGKGTFLLDGVNTTTLSNATLTLNTDNTTTVGGTLANPKIQSIGNLSLNGGILVFNGPVPPSSDVPGQIKTSHLNIQGGTVSVPLPTSQPENPTSGNPLLMQDDTIISSLITANTLSSGGTSLTIVDSNGIPIPAQASMVIKDGNNQNVATGYFSYGLNTTNGTTPGLYLTYGLTQLDLIAGKTLTLLGDTPSPGASELHALVTGDGNLNIQATTNITVNNSFNTYTGTTLVSAGKAILGRANSFGKTSALQIGSNATVDLNGNNQTIGSLTVNTQGLLNFNGGVLTITNGGSVLGTLTGAGSLNLSNGTFTASGDSSTLTAATSIASTASAILKHAAGLGAGNIINKGTLTFDGVIGIVNNTISGTGSLTKLGTGMLTLLKDHIYTGQTTVKGGIFQIGNGGTTGSLTSDIALDQNTQFLFNRSTDLTYGNVISGTGTFSKLGNDILTFTKDHTYTGLTTLNGGTLQIGNGGTVGSLVSDVVLGQNTQLFFNRSTDLTYGNVISGTGTFSKLGNGLLTFTKDHTYTGLTTLNGGTLQIGNGGTTGSLTSDVALGQNTKLIFNRSNDLTYTNVISGTGSLSKLGTQKLILSKDHTYTGPTTIKGGTLQIGNGGTTGSLKSDVSLDQNTQIIFNHSTDFTYANVFSGAGSLIKQGSGILTLSKSSPSFTGKTTISQGALTLQNLNSAGTGPIENNAALNLDFSGVFANNITNNNAILGLTTIPSGRNVSLSGINTTSWAIIGNATITTSNNLGSGQINLAGSLNLVPTAAGGFIFNNSLSGSGLLNATMAHSNDAFNFTPTVGNAFTGTVALGKGTFFIDGINTSTLKQATLKLNEDTLTTVGGTPANPSPQEMGGLHLNGGTLIFPTAQPSQPVLPNCITTNTLTITNGSGGSAGTIQIDLPNSDNPPENWSPSQTSQPLLMQDDTLISTLVDATSVNGAASHLTLIDAQGIPIIPQQDQSITIDEAGIKQATGFYGYGLTSTSKALNLTYGLTQLTLEEGQNLVLAGDNTSETGASDMHALLTGLGGIDIQASNHISLSNTHNDYTGPTMVTSGSALMKANDVLGQTSSLNILSGSRFDLNATKQTVGSLATNGLLDLNGGTLSVTNGGTISSNNLKGSGSLNLTKGNFIINGANPDLTAQISISPQSHVTLTTPQGLGTKSIANDGGLTLQGATGSFTIPVSGAGSLSIINQSNVSLATANTYTGGTNVINSTVTLNTDQNLGASTSPLSLDNSTVHFNASLSNQVRPIALKNINIFDTNGQSISLESPMSGEGGLTKSGSGRLSLIGQKTFTGSVIVDAGELKVNGSLTSSVTINPQAVFSGNNTVKNLINKGIIAPGNSIGTIKVLDTFDNTDGTYQCEVNDALQSDLIHVQGPSTVLQGTLEVIPMPGVYKAGQTSQYTILTSTSPINTKFDKISGLSPLFIYTPLYQQNSVILAMTRFFNFNDVVPNGNAGVIGRVLSHTTTVGKLADIIGKLYTLPKQALSDALNRLGTASNTIVQTSIANAFFDMAEDIGSFNHSPLERSTFKSPLKSLASNLNGPTIKSSFSSNSHKAESDKSSGLFSSHDLNGKPGQASMWLKTDGGSFTQKSFDKSGTFLPGFTSGHSRTQIGMDYHPSHKTLLGIITAYDYTSYRFSDTYGKGNLNTNYLGVYGTYLVTPTWYINGVLSYGHSRQHAKRQISFSGFTAQAENSHNTHQVGALIETGYDYHLPSNFIVTPMVNLGLISSHENGYREKGADTANLHVKKQNRTYLQTKIGSQLSKYFIKGNTQFFGFVKLAYTRRRSLSGANNVTASFMDQEKSFTTYSHQKTRDFISPGIGLTALFDNNIYISISYGGNLSSSQRSHEGMIKIGKEF